MSLIRKYQVGSLTFIQDSKSTYWWQAKFVSTSKERVPAAACWHFYKLDFITGFEIMSQYHIKRGGTHRYSDLVITAPSQYSGQPTAIIELLATSTRKELEHLAVS